jgi:MoxR-like ATPase
MYEPENRLNLEPFAEKTAAVRQEMEKYIVGQDNLITLLLTALISNGHVLIEGVPGVAKTQTARLLARVVDTGFKRIQFTPDLLPSDITGTAVYNNKTSSFSFHRGPLFTNLVLADEINRAPAKTQAALFEAMEERQITVDGTTYALDKPFMVLATQNPVDLEGTYRLPEAQIDRFLFKIIVDYPSQDEETEIINRHNERGGNIDIDKISPVIKNSELLEMQVLARQVFVHPNIIGYIAAIVSGTRNNPVFYLGASPRASIAILESAKTFAAINGRDFITPDDVKFTAPYVLNHRVLLSPEKEIAGGETANYIEDVINAVEIPK